MLSTARQPQLSPVLDLRGQADDAPRRERIGEAALQQLHGLGADRVERLRGGGQRR